MIWTVDTVQTSKTRIRAVVVDHNGQEMTASCVSSLLAEVPPNVDLQVVVVDNGSARSVTESMARDPRVEVRRSDVNLGFAGGANVGLVDLDELDYVALVNNDVEVGRSWLEPLVECLRADESLGAASPKMLFAGHFHEIELTVEAHVRGRGDQRPLGIRFHEAMLPPDARSGAQLVRGFYGPEEGGPGLGWFQWTQPGATLRVPTEAVVDRRVALRLSAEHPVMVTATSGTEVTSLTVGTTPAIHEIAVGDLPVDIVNNAGTVLLADGYGADRGALERDHGQFDQASLIDAWCGGAVLLRSDYLRDVGVFDDRLFLYYEDVELSIRGTERGWRYRYDPRSVVRHRHGATAMHGSRRTEIFKERNRLLVLARHSGVATAMRAAVRYLLVTASYTRRDVVSPMLHAERPHFAIVARRLAAFGGFLRMLPSMRASASPAHVRAGADQ